MGNLTTNQDTDTENVSDTDECDSSEIARLFFNSKCTNSVKVSEDEYILHMTATRFVEQSSKQYDN